MFRAMVAGCGVVFLVCGGLNAGMETWVRYYPTPGQTEVAAATVNGKNVARVTFAFPAEGYRVEWLQLRRSNRTFAVQVEAERFTGPSAQVRIYRTMAYDLGSLPSGIYHFKVMMRGRQIRSQEFLVSRRHQ